MAAMGPSFCGRRKSGAFLSNERWHVDPGTGSTRSAHHEAGVAPDGHLLAFLMIGYDATGVRQHSSLLAGDVRAHVPRVSLRNECRVGHFVMVLDPVVLRLLGRLDLGQAASLHVVDAARD